MCDTMVTLTDDGVLFAKNSDRDVNECQVVEWHPADDAGGTTTRCTSIEVEGVASTNAVMLSRPWWMWGAEMGANEHGVVIGNEAVFTDQPYSDTGLLGMDLLRLALERATSAEAAVQVIVTMLERYGQGGAGSLARPDFVYHNSFIVADPSGAIVLETAGSLWATEVVAAGTARSISNGLTIPGFAEAHADRQRGHRNGCALRRGVTEAGARVADGPSALMATLRSHGPHEHPHYSAVRGGMAAPCVHAGGPERLTETTSSWVADLRPGTSDARHWVTATAAPCTSLFKPARVGEPVDVGPVGTDTYDESSAWWRHEWLHRVVDRDPAAGLALFAAERDALEAAWVDDPPASADAFALAEASEERWRAAAMASIPTDLRPKSVRDPRDALNSSAGMSISPTALRRTIQRRR